MPLYLSDLIENDLAKEAIEDGVLYPILMPSLYPNQANAILFYGPPGTGKTLLARATAFELNKRSDVLQVLFYAPTTDQFKGKFVGETEEKITKLFTCASQKASEHQALLHKKGHKNTKVKSIMEYLFESNDMKFESFDEWCSMSTSLNPTHRNASRVLELFPL